MTKFQVYDLNQNRKVDFPLPNKGHRLSIIFFYLKRCVPSLTHLNYFANYASTHRAQVMIYFISILSIFYYFKYNYLSINCDPDNIDDLKNLTQTYKDIQCYTDFLSADFECKLNKFLHLSILF